CGVRNIKRSGASRERCGRARPAADCRVDCDSGQASARGRGCWMIVVAEHLSKWYGQVSALNDVTVTIPSGVTGLLGPNGAGKSTFMKLMTGQLRPSAGKLLVLNNAIWENPSQYARIGFCPEQDGFYERMTGSRWLEALARLHGMSTEAA